MPTITIDEFTMVRAYDHVPRFLWANDLPGYSSVPPAVGFDGAFFVLTDGGAFNQPSLWAIERDGRVRWSATDVQIPSQIAVTPAGTLLVPDREQRRVHAVSPRDGSVIWTREIEGEMSLATLAVSATGDVYVRSTTALTALAADGAVRWRFAPGGDGGLGLAPLVDVEGHVYVAFGDRVYSLTSTGELRWEAEVPKARDLFIAADGVLYVVSGDQVLVAIEGQGSR
jgi:outer membrane protein assembly factor BamB